VWAYFFFLVTCEETITHEGHAQEKNGGKNRKLRTHDTILNLTYAVLKKSTIFNFVNEEYMYNSIFFNPDSVTLISIYNLPEPT
jgi:hypothetical protein